MRFVKLQIDAVENNKDYVTGRGNNPMVGMTVAVAVAIEEAMK